MLFRSSHFSLTSSFVCTSSWVSTSSFDLCRGLYTQGQDNNLGACRFYLKAGFRIGGLDTEVYKGTNQEGKADILFYRDV